MTKTELIERIASDCELSKAVAARMLDSFTSNVTKALQNDDNVVLVGFGTFLARFRAARTGRNPQTGQEIAIAASNVPSFKPGATLKKALN